MARTVNYRLQTGPGAWVRASGELPFDITGLTNGEIYEVDIGDGVLLERTPTGVANSVDLQTPLVYDDTAINVHTFAAGFSAAIDDTIVLGISARTTSGTQGLLAVTIGGQTMTVAAVTNAIVLAGHAIRKLTAPISPTDEIVVTFAATGLYSHSRIMPWKCVGYDGAFHATSSVGTSSNATSVSTTIDVPADGAVFVTQTNAQTTNNTGTMTGATKEVDELLGIRRTVAGHASGLLLEVGRTITVESVDVVARRLSAVSLGVA